MTKKAKIMEKLIKIQNELKAPKNQRNTFGNYNYRSCEDILEAVKPLLFVYKCTLVITDDIIEVGGRVYVKATCRFSDGENHIQVTAMAREAEAKKGMDESQLTGTASSYARKYALNGLFLIDDTKDADTNENRDYVKKRGEYEIKKVIDLVNKAVTEDQLKQIWFENEKYQNELKEVVNNRKLEILKTKQ